MTIDFKQPTCPACKNTGHDNRTSGNVYGLYH